MPQLEKMLVVQDDITESLWVADLGGGVYQVNNTPFFAYNVSLNDKVHASLLDGALQLEGIVDKSGIRTVRIILKEETGLASATGHAVMAFVVANGIHHEVLEPSLIALSIHPGFDLHTLESYLNGFSQEQLIWEYGDPQKERPLFTKPGSAAAADQQKHDEEYEASLLKRIFED